ncbi:hypothetical protein QBC44DRAFT_345105 [Cladorrhinum sp. PSN332]|nr:hypothetical protein QBC44DRAFT_345105 [Cladorrhinum sp. PSN332]
MLLQLNSGDALENAHSDLKVSIQNVIYSKTLSCVMLVDILDQGSSKRLPSSAVLKLYDRRFAEGFREQKRHDPWERDIEEGYVEFVRTGEFDKLIRGIHQLPRKVYKYEPQGGEEWYDGECEAALADELHEMFKEETAVYKTLRNLQGLLIPKLLAKVELDIAPPQVDTNPVDGLEPFKIKGILMQRLEGFPLREISHRCPRSAWQDIVDQAISLTRIFSDYDIINNDVRTENFIISECKPDQEYRVYIIDFGNCRHRRKGESDFEWCRENSLKGQDGYIASVMAKVLEKHEFNLEDGCKVWVHPDYEGAVYHLEV